MKRRITRITVQTEREVIFNRGEDTHEAWCERCAKSVRVVDSSEAARLLQLDPAAMLVDDDGIHLIEATEAGFLICLDSLRGHTNSDY